MKKDDLAMLMSRIESRTEVNRKTGCKLWIGSQKRAHGVIKHEGKNHAVHRIAWMATNGPIKSSRWVLHRCGVSNCHNVEHLYLGTRLQNAADRQRHGRYIGPFPSGSSSKPPKIEKRYNAPHADLTHTELLRLVKYDAETGIFTWNTRPDRDRMWNTRFAEKPAGAVTGKGYHYVNICGKLRLAHRLAYFYMMGDWPLLNIDHINRDRTDNRWSNLRMATVSENAFNQEIRSDNKSGVKGVSFDKRRKQWIASITVDYKLIHRSFDKKTDAIECRRDMERRLHGDFAATKGVA